MNPLRAGGVMELRSGVWSSHGAAGEWVIVATARVCTDQRPLALEGGMLPAPPPHSFLHKEKRAKKPLFQENSSCFSHTPKTQRRRKTKYHFPTDTMNCRARLKLGEGLHHGDTRPALPRDSGTAVMRTAPKLHQLLREMGTEGHSRVRKRRGGAGEADISLKAFTRSMIKSGAEQGFGSGKGVGPRRDALREEDGCLAPTSAPNYPAEG